MKDDILPKSWFGLRTGLGGGLIELGVIGLGRDRWTHPIVLVIVVGLLDLGLLL
jgi:hypothetical protein